MKQTAYTLARIQALTGTITDISELCIVDHDVIKYGPEITAKDLKAIETATKKRLWCENEVIRIDFHKDGKRILNFATAYQQRRNDLWNDFFQDSETETDWNLQKMVLRWFVECSEAEVKQKCVAWLNLDLQESDWQMILEAGAGFLKRHPEMQEITAEEKKALARAFAEVRDDLQSHLIRFWLELFDLYGIEGAKTWIKSNWKPLNDETREQINAAYTAAKNKYTK
jgi:hypothetical protein